MTTPSQPTLQLRLLKGEDVRADGTTPRQHTRYGVTEPIMVQSLQMKDFRRLKIGNLSASGMFVESSDLEIRPGDALLFVISPKRRKESTITGIGKVKWVRRPSQAGGRAKSGFGFEITHLLSEENAKNYRKYVTAMSVTLD